MALREKAYIQDCATIKKFSEDKYKFTYMKSCRNSGIELPEKENNKKPIKGTVNSTKLENNISRTKSIVNELALCNDWEYFCTLTISDERFNRFDLGKINRKISLFIRDYNKKHKSDIQYLLIPEKHQNGAWHLHGFFKGFHENELNLFTKGQKLPKYINDKLNKNEPIFDWQLYRDSFGWCCFEPIKNNEAAARYVTKYITKDLAKCVSTVNAHMYYCSKNLKRAELIKRGTLVEAIPWVDYENDYVKVCWFDLKKIALEDMTRRIIDC